MQNGFFEKFNELREQTLVDRSFSNYYRLSRQLPGVAASADIPTELSISVAFLGNLTFDPLVRYVRVAALREGLWVHTYEAPYGQYAQELLASSSKLSVFAPNLAILLLDHSALLPEPSLDALKRGISLLLGLAERFEQMCDGILLVHNLPVPTFTHQANLELTDRVGRVRMTCRFNEELAEAFQDNKQCYVVDLDGILGDYGKRGALDPRMNFAARLPFAFDFLPDLTNHYLGYMKAIRGRTRKCIVLDADNTLWGGIVGEDGPEKIALGPTPPGNAFVAFQELILQYFKRGIILALNSRNNPDDVFDVLDNHPYQLLKRHHFAALKINWKSKAENLIEIAKELNIGLDSMVFIDDDPFNREQVRGTIRDVLVLEVSNDPTFSCTALLNINDLFALSITEEDRHRGEMYVTERLRTEDMATAKSLDEYLAQLEMRVTLRELDEFSLPRAAQLCQRTNQFNATTPRYTESEIRSMWASKDWILITESLQDRYGDSGIIGLCFVKIENNIAFVDTLLMSCRSLGRGVEDALLREGLSRAQQKGATLCRTKILYTRKNAPVRDFYKNLGFNCVHHDDVSSTWEVKLATLSIPIPHYLEAISCVSGE